MEDISITNKIIRISMLGKIQYPLKNEVILRQQYEKANIFAYLEGVEIKLHYRKYKNKFDARKIFYTEYQSLNFSTSII